MVKLPFNLICPSCQSRLLVRQQELIGHILTCPKCGGMVLVEPPEETPADSAKPAESQETDSTKTTSDTAPTDSASPEPETSEAPETETPNVETPETNTELPESDSPRENDETKVVAEEKPDEKPSEPEESAPEESVSETSEQAKQPDQETKADESSSGFAKTVLPPSELIARKIKSNLTDKLNEKRNEETDADPEKSKPARANRNMREDDDVEDRQKPKKSSHGWVYALIPTFLILLGGSYLVGRYWPPSESETPSELAADVHPEENPVDQVSDSLVKPVTDAIQEFTAPDTRETETTQVNPTTEAAPVVDAPISVSPSDENTTVKLPPITGNATSIVATTPGLTTPDSTTKTTEEPIILQDTTQDQKPVIEPEPEVPAPVKVDVPDVQSTTDENTDENKDINKNTSTPSLEETSENVLNEEIEDDREGIVILDTPEDRENVIPAQEIPVDELLRFPIKKISVPDVPFADVMRVFSQLTNVPVKLDLDEMRARRFSVNSKLELELESTTGAGLLKAIEEATGLVSVSGPGYIVLTYPESEKNRTFEKRYDLSLLLNQENPPTSEQLLDTIKSLVTPEQWDTEKANIAIDGKELVLTHNGLGHDQVERLVLVLHFMRNIEPKTDLTPEQIAPEAMGWDLLCRETSFNYYEPTPLKEILDTLEKNRKIRILVDEESLFAAGLSQESKAMVKLDNGTVNEILESLLVSLGLTYRIMETNVLEVTTLDATDRHPTVELHRCPPLEEGKTPDEITRTMQSVFDPESWKESGGDGVISYDTASKLFLIRQSQPTQRNIRIWLGERTAQEQESPSNPESAESDQAVLDIDRISVELDQEELDTYYADMEEVYDRLLEDSKLLEEDIAGTQPENEDRIPGTVDFESKMADFDSKLSDLDIKLSDIDSDVPDANSEVVESVFSEIVPADVKPEPSVIIADVEPEPAKTEDIDSEQVVTTVPEADRMDQEIGKEEDSATPAVVISEPSLAPPQTIVTTDAKSESINTGDKKPIPTIAVPEKTEKTAGSSESVKPEAESVDAPKVPQLEPKEEETPKRIRLNTPIRVSTIPVSKKAEPLPAVQSSPVIIHVPSEQVPVEQIPVEESEESVNTVSDLGWFDTEIPDREQGLQVVPPGSERFSPAFHAVDDCDDPIDDQSGRFETFYCQQRRTACCHHVFHDNDMFPCLKRTFNELLCAVPLCLFSNHATF